MITGRDLINYYEDTKLYSTGYDDLDDLLEKAFCDGYDEYYTTRKFAYVDEEGNIRSANGRLLADKEKFENAENLFELKGENGKTKKLREPSRYKGGTQTGRKGYVYDGEKYIIRDKAENHPTFRRENHTPSASEQKKLKEDFKIKKEFKKYDGTADAWKAAKRSKKSPILKEQLSTLKKDLTNKREYKKKYSEIRAKNNGRLISPKILEKLKIYK